MQVKGWSIVLEGRAVYVEYVPLSILKEYIRTVGAKGARIKKIRRLKHKAIVVYSLPLGGRADKSLMEWLVGGG